MPSNTSQSHPSHPPDSPLAEVIDPPPPPRRKYRRVSLSPPPERDAAPTPSSSSSLALPPRPRPPPPPQSYIQEAYNRPEPSSHRSSNNNSRSERWRASPTRGEGLGEGSSGGRDSREEDDGGWEAGASSSRDHSGGSRHRVSASDGDWRLDRNGRGGGGSGYEEGQSFGRTSSYSAPRPQLPPPAHHLPPRPSYSNSVSGPSASYNSAFTSPSKSRLDSAREERLRAMENDPESIRRDDHRGRDRIEEDEIVEVGSLSKPPIDQGWGGRRTRRDVRFDSATRMVNAALGRNGDGGSFERRGELSHHPNSSSTFDARPARASLDPSPSSSSRPIIFYHQQPQQHQHQHYEQHQHPERRARRDSGYSTADDGGWGKSAFEDASSSSSRNGGGACRQEGGREVVERTRVDTGYGSSPSRPESSERRREERVESRDNDLQVSPRVASRSSREDRDSESTRLESRGRSRSPPRSNRSLPFTSSSRDGPPPPPSFHPSPSHHSYGSGRPVGSISNNNVASPAGQAASTGGYSSPTLPHKQTVASSPLFTQSPSPPNSRHSHHSNSNYLQLNGDPQTPPSRHHLLPLVATHSGRGGNTIETARADALTNAKKRRLVSDRRKEREREEATKEKELLKKTKKKKRVRRDYSSSSDEIEDEEEEWSPKKAKERGGTLKGKRSTKKVSKKLVVLSDTDDLDSDEEEQDHQRRQRRTRSSDASPLLRSPSFSPQIQTNQRHDSSSSSRPYQYYQQQQQHQQHHQQPLRVQPHPAPFQLPSQAHLRAYGHEIPVDLFKNVPESAGTWLLASKDKVSDTPAAIHRSLARCRNLPSSLRRKTPPELRGTSRSSTSTFNANFSNAHSSYNITFSSTGGPPSSRPPVAINTSLARTSHSHSSFPQDDEDDGVVVDEARSRPSQKALGKRRAVDPEVMEAEEQRRKKEREREETRRRASMAMDVIEIGSDEDEVEEDGEVYEEAEEGETVLGNEEKEREEIVFEDPVVVPAGSSTLVGQELQPPVQPLQTEENEISLARKTRYEAEKDFLVEKIENVGNGTSIQAELLRKMKERRDDLERALETKSDTRTNLDDDLLNFYKRHRSELETERRSSYKKEHNFLLRKFNHRRLPTTTDEERAFIDELVHPVSSRARFFIFPLESAELRSPFRLPLSSFFSDFDSSRTRFTLRSGFDLPRWNPTPL
ncbi:hypothetical protein BDY24DRAFT_390156 [Mrakia frigida]|uniref:uncharacterized protein n=1 Tax=Mrakia frigida TaxID=29902 RepID=UPI003FCBF81D